MARPAARIRCLSLCGQDQEDIYAMGLLHDIGKIGVAGSIIRKDSRLTDAEYQDIKEHTITGYNILKKITALPGLAIGARWHHEHFDGTDYPDGLRGSQISEEACIIAIADAYDAMTCKRAYTEIRPKAEVRTDSRIWICLRVFDFPQVLCGVLCRLCRLCCSKLQQE